MELTSSSSKNKLEAREKISKSRKPVLNLNKLKIETGTQETVKKEMRRKCNKN